MRYLLSILTLMFLVGSTQLLAVQNVIKGQTALITFSKVPNDAKVTYGKKSIPLLKDPLDTSRHYVLLPVPYRSGLGKKTLTVTYPGGKKRIELNVEDGAYKSETIKVSPSKVKPDKEQAKRTAAEYREAMRIYDHLTPTRAWDRPFIYPIRSHITSPFGTARVYNGSLKGFHSGTDFRAEVGTSVHAVNDGNVVLAKDRYYAGNSVIVDHGEGLYSCYYHLSRLDVRPGDKVSRDDVLGLSGATGRVTGPHLHFAVMLYGVQVDPLQLLTQINSLFRSRKILDTP